MVKKLLPIIFFCLDVPIKFGLRCAHRTTMPSQPQDSNMNNKILPAFAEAHEANNQRSAFEKRRREVEFNRRLSDGFDSVIAAEFDQVVERQPEPPMSDDDVELHLCGAEADVYRLSTLISDQIGNSDDRFAAHFSELARLHVAAGALLRAIEGVAGREWLPPAIDTKTFDLVIAGGYLPKRDSKECWLTSAPMPYES
jgi:hypothetical protein